MASQKVEDNSAKVHGAANISRGLVVWGMYGSLKGKAGCCSLHHPTRRENHNVFWTSLCFEGNIYYIHYNLKACQF